MGNWVKDNKGAGSAGFNFIEQYDVLGYLNNPGWVETPDNVDKHKPCGHWHKGPVFSAEPMIWPFEKQKAKYAYNDGDILTSDVNPVWPIGSRAGLPAAQAEKHIPCGYWFDSPQVQTYVPYIPFNIVNFDGETATDTILRNGTLTYKAVGEGSPSVIWSVSADAGSTLGGSTITPEGVLTAGPTSCGTLKVTASSPGYGTSDTQYVRVTDAGQWGNVQYHTCNATPWSTLGTCIPKSQVTEYIGKYKFQSGDDTCWSMSYGGCDAVLSPGCYSMAALGSTIETYQGCSERLTKYYTGLPCTGCGYYTTGYLVSGINFSWEWIC